MNYLLFFILFSFNLFALDISSDQLGISEKNLEVRNNFYNTYEVTISEDFLYLKYPKVDLENPCLNLSNCIDTKSESKIVFTRNFTFTLNSTYDSDIKITPTFDNVEDQEFYNVVFKEGSDVIEDISLSDGNSKIISIEFTVYYSGPNFIRNPKGYIVFKSEILP